MTGILVRLRLIRPYYPDTPEGREEYERRLAKDKQQMRQLAWGAAALAAAITLLFVADGQGWIDDLSAWADRLASQ